MNSEFIDKIIFTRVLNPKYHGNLIGGLHAHKNNYQLIFIEKGAGEIGIESQRFAVEANDLICIRPNQLHCSFEKNPGYFELIEILWYFKDGIQPELQLDPIARVSPDAEIISSLQRLVREALLKPPQHRLLMRLLLSDILIQYERLTPHIEEQHLQVIESIRTQKIKKIVEHIHLNYQKSLRLDDLARMGGFSSHYLCRLFKELTNYTPISYLIKIRLDMAIDLLKNSEYTISEISEMVGFEDVYYFSRLFKKWMGKSPRYFVKTN